MSVASLKVVVIGAGFGGLAAAAHLRRAGAEVTVLERASTVGGKAARLERDGFLLDAGPTLLTMPWIAEETFAVAGVGLAEVAPLTRVEPSCRYVLPDRTDLVLSADAARSRDSVARLSPRDAAHWDGFMADCRAIWEVAGEPYLEAPFEGFFSFAGRVFGRGRKARKLGALRGTLDELGRRHFQSAAMRAFVGHFATYAGTSPARASAAMAMIPYIEICLGAYYPRGGIHALAAALAEAVAARGVRVLTSKEVTGIEVDDGGRATGVTLRARGGGSIERLAADVVVANVDPLRVAVQLVPERWRRAAGADALGRRVPSMSGFAWAFGLKGAAPESSVHTMLMPRDFDDEMAALFERGQVAADPTVWLSVPSLIDPGRAPAGHHTVFALLYAPPTALTTDWARESVRLRALLCARLERRWKRSIERDLCVEAFVTPCDIARTGSPDGAIYGEAPNGPLAAFTRPANRVRAIRGLYLVGGATHPGGSITLTMRGGRFVAALVSRDVERGRLWPIRERRWVESGRPAVGREAT